MLPIKLNIENLKTESDPDRVAGFFRKKYQLLLRRKNRRIFRDETMLKIGDRFPDTIASLIGDCYTNSEYPFFRGSDRGTDGMKRSRKATGGILIKNLGRHTGFVRVVP